MTEITTVVQTQTIADTTTNWTLPSTFAQFDPSLGTLVDVRIGVTGDVDGTASIENLGAAATPVEVFIPVGFAVSSPDGADQGSVTVDPTTTVNLGAYDGSTDYTGSSGTIVSGITASNSAVFVDSGDLGAFIGTGTVDLSTQAIGNAIETGDGNLMTTLATKAGAVVSVQYGYNPIETTTVGGGSDSGSVFTSLSPNNGWDGVFAILPQINNWVTTAAQSFTIGSKTAGWIDTLGVTRFDPTLGTLEAVRVTLNGSIIASAAAENTGDSAITFSTTQEAVVTLGLPGTSNASVALNTKDSMNLASYDGTTDFSGSSGHTDLGLTDPSAPFDGSFFASETDPSILAAFTGVGTYDLPISSTGTSFAQGDANLVSELTLEPGADVEISYVYAPSVACFAAGTRILTDSGPIAVEHLTVGMQAVTAASGTPASITWIGHRTVDCRRHPKPLAVSPVRIRAGAFGPGLPSRDVLLSPDHAVFFNEVLIPVRLLVNGTSVVRETVDHITYYHIELDRHDLLLAEGLPTESYLETGGRSAFANGGGATQLHPDFAALMWDGHGYAPLVVTGAPLRAAKAHLAAVAKGGKVPTRKTRARKG